MEFVFAWCTDYQPDDGALAREEYQRRILVRTPRHVRLEDLEDTPTGWVWKRTDVRLLPPDHWTAESVGNHRDFSLDYRLRPLANGRTEFRLTGVRRSKPPGGPNPSKARMERELQRLWRNLGSALERDFRSQQRPRR
jgi:hypothetical protein